MYPARSLRTQVSFHDSRREATWRSTPSPLRRVPGRGVAEEFAAVGGCVGAGSGFLPVSGLAVERGGISKGVPREIGFALTTEVGDALAVAFGRGETVPAARIVGSGLGAGVSAVSLGVGVGVAVGVGIAV